MTDVQLLLPRSLVAQDPDGMWKVEDLSLLGIDASAAAADAFAAEGKLNPTVGGLSHGKYPTKMSPSGEGCNTPWTPVALKILVITAIGLLQ